MAPGRALSGENHTKIADFLQIYGGKADPVYVKTWFQRYGLLVIPASLVVGLAYYVLSGHYLNQVDETALFHLEEIKDSVQAALRNPDALVSLVSSLRRGSTLVAFAGGLWFFGERNGRQKLPAVLGILGGIALTLLG